MNTVFTVERKHSMRLNSTGTSVNYMLSYVCLFEEEEEEEEVV